jgi:NAD(P)-dependent dehydrogenase (short-subunit alcohol dehydrogenase family)
LRLRSLLEFDALVPVVAQIGILSSVAGFGALSGSAAYAASKAAVRVYGESLRWQLQREGVRVNVICPGVSNRLEDTVCNAQTCELVLYCST